MSKNKILLKILIIYTYKLCSNEAEERLKNKSSNIITYKHEWFLAFFNLT